MFKSLLRTLPSLSGNFTIACKLNEIKKDDNENYHTYVRVADLMPLQNNIYKNSIELNLLNGKYEHDIKKYFIKYSNYFYKENFTYDKNNYKILNLDSLYNETNDNRNKDYEFGCKRIYYSRTGYQFAFYAPFYLDDINNLPDYFGIHIKIGNIEKVIKVYLNKDNKINYLKRYLTSYFEGVDNRVIFCLPDSLQATYFGIDVKKGGFVQYKDNIFGYLYTNQIMLNNFDKLICQGFERNNLIMKQIIPISFIFNINDLLTEYERSFFAGYKMNIYGYYYKNDLKLDMFDFDIDYFKSYDKYNKYNSKSAKYEYVNGNDGNSIINIMDVGYPALNESKYIKYEFENKISPNYCKFKMMLSSDDNPYITNVNFAYSYLQYPNQKYGYFPTTFKGINPKLVCVDYDIKLPIGNNIESYYINSSYNANTIITNDLNYNKFIKLMQNYTSSWFNVGNIDDIDELCNNNKLWSDVVFNYAYFKGILYNLNDLYKYNIDKFGVLLDFNINKISEADEYVKAKYVYSTSDSSSINTYKFNNKHNMKVYDPLLNVSYYNNFFINNVLDNNYYLHYDKLLVKDTHGKYIKETNYKNENAFIKLNDLYTLINNSEFPSSIKQKIYEYLNTEKTIGYLLLDGVHNMNYFEKYTDICGKEHLQFMLTNSLFNTNNKDANYEWLYNKLYYSTHISTNKVNISNNYDTLEYDEDFGGKFFVYLEDNFVNLYNIYFILNEIYKNTDNNNEIYSEITVNKLINAYNEFKNIYDAKNKYDTSGNESDLDNLCMILFNKHYAAIKDGLIDTGYDEDEADIEIKKIINESYIKSENKYKDEYLNSIFNKFTTSIDNNDKYVFNSYNKINGVDITNYFSKLTNNNDKDIYVDSYNLNNLIDIYNKENNSKISLQSSVSKEYYIKFLNKDHIKEYFYKLNNDETGFNTSYYDSLIDDAYFGLNILKSTYVKERYWIIDNGVIETKDIYTTLYNYILKYLLKHDKLEPEIIGNETYYSTDENTEKVIKIIYDLLQEDNETIFNFIYDNISENRNTNNKFELTIDSIKIELDLCFRKKVYKLDSTLFNLLYKDNKISNYLYLYINDACQNENKTIWPIINSTYISTYNTNVTYKSWELNIDKKLYQENINEYLVPLFSNVYVDEYNTNIIYNMIQHNKIYNYKYILNEEEYYKEIDVIETLYNIYKDKSDLISSLYYNYDKSNVTLETQIENLIKYNINILSSTLLNNFTNLNSPYLDANHLLQYLNDYDEQNLETLKNAIIYIVQNESKINELNDFIVSNGLSDLFNNDYIINNNIDIDALSTNELVHHKLNFLYEYAYDKFYELVKMNGITLYSIQDTLTLSLENGCPNNMTYDKDNKIYIYHKDDITYGFYYLNINIDNSNYSFNILDDYNLNILFNTVNGNDILDKSFVKNIFYILYPFLRINIFEEFTKQVKTLSYQNELEILIKYKANGYLSENEKYKYTNYIDSLNDKLYSSLIEFDNYKKIKLLRYFNYITPYLKKISNIIDNVWTLRFMENNNKYNNIKKYNTLNIDNINIYKYSPLTIYYESYNEESDTNKKKYQFTNSYVIKQYEYKHFNDNALYNLPEQIILYDENVYELSLIKNIENDSEYLYNSKVNILYKFFSENGLDYTNIKLFLYNKYDSSFFIEKDNNKYRIKYVFNLI